ncbi:hypothetical protein NEIELOOT_00912 [Neisseria elongata subsp. glycolytica ATCC 29315]|uniref:Uncharacterized protein n=2 Tax=Neisseria elongata subsp. glycolytica ATCC 29315 TaxID=546263 RepID=D4DPC5_NEIEG|nr:hypothetical protein NEIELOOT_00912 [Neisseria elongata subsp. glycolytica ATCC 29315]
MDLFFQPIKGANMKSRNMMLATAIVAAFGLAGCNSNRAPDNGGTDSHHTETRATGGNTKTTGRVCQLLQDDNPNRGGRKVVYRCNGRAVLASDEAKRLLNPSVPVSFGGSGSVVQSNLITRQAANATGKSDEAACERAFINAAHKFQATAQSRNANRVSNFHSYYNRKILRGGQYDCEVGTFHARVVMRGDIAR